MAVCRLLSDWLEAMPARRVLFVEVPSKMKWGIQHKAHARANDLPPISHGIRPETTLDKVRKDLTDSCLDAWATQVRDPDYLGHNFLRLREPNGKHIRPMYSNGGAVDSRWSRVGFAVESR